MTKQDTTQSISELTKSIQIDDNTENSVNIDLFDEHNAVGEVIDFELEYDPNEIGFDNLEVGYDEEISLIESSMNKIEEDSDQHLKVAALFGIDLSSGKQAKGLDQSLTDILLDVDFEVDETDEAENEIQEANRDFDTNEKSRLKDILTGIIIFHKDIENENKSKDRLKQLEENNKNRNNLMNEKRQADKESVEVIENYKKTTQLMGIYDKEEKRKELSPTERNFIKSASKESVKKLHRNNETKVKRVYARLEQIKEGLIMCDEIEDRIISEVQSLKQNRNQTLLTDIEKEVDKVIENSKKVVQIQFGVLLFDSEFKEVPIAIRCSCGHKDVYDISQLPYYISGNAYDNFKERSYTDSSVKKNYFSDRGHIKNKDTKVKLERERNLIESRIQIPGITNKNMEPLVCKGCQSNLLFTPDVIDKLAERGFVADVFTAELAASSEGKKFGITLDTSQVVKIFLSHSQIENKYITDLGLTDYKLSKISSDINEDDTKRNVTKLGNKARIDEESLRRYAGKPTGEINLKQVEEELEGHVKNINIAIDEMLKQYRIVKIKPTMSERQKVNQTNKNERNQKVNRFLRNSRSIILKYCIDNKISSQGIKALIDKHKTDIKEFKHLLLEFLIDYLINSVIEGKTTFIFEEGYARTIHNEEMVLPHTNFFDCYRPIIKEYFMDGEFNNIKKDVHLTEHYNLFRTLSTISRIPDYETRVKTSEEFVKMFRKKLGKPYQEKKEQLFFEYLNNNIKYESNFDENNKCFGWLYYEMITQDKVIRNTEVQDQELFERLYGDELRENGHFFIFQGNTQSI